MGPLSGCVIAVSGTTLNLTKKQIEGLIVEAGAEYAKTVKKSCTHLITSWGDYENASAKKAIDLGIPVLIAGWIEESIKQKKKMPETRYDLARYGAACAAIAAGLPIPAWKTDKTDKTDKTVISGKKRKGKTDDAEEEEEEEEDEDTTAKATTKGGRAVKKAKAAPAKAPAKRGKKKAATPEEEDEEEEEEEEMEEEEEEKDVEMDVDEHAERERQKEYEAPVDSGFWQGSLYKVYSDKSGTKFDASLNQTNVGQNNNKFYIAQILQHRTNTSSITVWTRWGRVGENGQSKDLGPFYDFDSAFRAFDKKFKDKSGCTWTDRLKANKPGKYWYIEKDYAPPEDEEEKKTKGKGKGKADDDEVAVVSKLDSAIQELMGLIFNKGFMQQTMARMNYDSNKLPLGRLGKKTIKDGYLALKAIAEVLANPAMAQTKYGQSANTVYGNLTNAYYSTIPHSFGRNHPPIINSDDRLKAEIELVESLGDMEIASKIMKDVEYATDADGNRIHPMDQQYNSLGLVETTTLPHDSSEFTLLSDYFTKTHGKTHGHIRAKIMQIFRIERSNEEGQYAKETYDKFANDDRRLLWHGSRSTNFAGILSQGLRIAPPEAPVNGYMFGKGIYLADISTKSAGYCNPQISNNIGLMLLCEAQLGDPMLELTNADYYAAENAKKAGALTTLGLGLNAPMGWMDAKAVNPNLEGVKMPDPSKPPGASNVKNAYLQYNEYIVYSVPQVKLRYLFMVNFNP